MIETMTKGGRSFALRFRAYGIRRYLTLGTAEDGWDCKRAEQELQNVLADVRRGLWQPPGAPIVETPQEEPTFHVLASEWVERRRHEVDERTVEHWTWALSNHLLPFFLALRPSEINTAAVERYKAAKLTERQRRLEELERWRKTPAETRGRRPAAPLGNESINKTLKLLAQVLDDAVEFGYLDTNPARGKRRRLKAAKPRRTWLELHEIQASSTRPGGTGRCSRR